MRLFRAVTDIGLHAMLLPEEYGGAAASAIDNAIVQEELGAVDVGVASNLNLTMTVPNMIVVGGTDEQRRTWLTQIAQSNDHILAGALNEPDVAGSELFCPLASSEIGIHTTATPHGDSYINNGTKAGWVTNGGIAKGRFRFHGGVSSLMSDQLGLPA